MRRRGTTIRWLLLAVAVGTPALGSWAWWSRQRTPADPMATAIAAYDRGDWEAAGDLARRRLKVARDDPDALRMLARVSIRQGRDEAGLSLYDRIGESGLRPEDLCVLGQSLARTGKRTSALKVWEEARSRDPGHAETLLELARAYLAADRLDQAAEAARALSARPGWESRGEALLGAIQLERNDPAAASESWTRAVERPRPTVRAAGVPSPIVPRTEIARALLRAGRPDEARGQLGIALTAGPEAEASWLLSRADLQRRDWAAARSDLARSGSFRDDHPLQPEPAVHVGASRCAGCHAEEFRAQQASRHARTFLRASELGDLELPGSPVPDPSDPAVRHTLGRDVEGRIRLRTEVAGRVFEAVVQYAFGSGDRGMTLVGRDPKGHAYELRLSDYPVVRGKSPDARPPACWDRTSGHPPRPPAAEGYLGEPMPEHEVRRCLLCHVTDPRSIADGSGPCANDRAIGCERCHGPGGNHLLAVEGKLAGIDPAIARPTVARGARVVALCAGCHSPRGQEVRRDDPLAVRFQGATLPWSRCYSESDDAMDCVTCHNPHRNAATDTRHYEAVCLGCHSRLEGRPTDVVGSSSGRRRSLREATPRTVCPVNPSTGCIGCHMPTVSGVVPHSSFTDHYIRVHRD